MSGAWHPPHPAKNQKINSFKNIPIKSHCGVWAAGLTAGMGCNPIRSHWQYPER